MTAEQYLSTALADHREYPLNVSRQRTLRACLRAVINHADRSLSASRRWHSAPIDEVAEAAAAILDGAPVEWVTAWAA